MQRREGNRWRGRSLRVQSVRFRQCVRIKLQYAMDARAASVIGGDPVQVTLHLLTARESPSRIAA